MRGMSRPGEWDESIPETREMVNRHEFVNIVSKIKEELSINKVIDFGCGEGLLSQCFDTDQYLGVDIDDRMLEVAKRNFSAYCFEKETDQIYSGDMCIASRVFSQLGQDVVHDILKRMRCKWMLVAENLPGLEKSERITSIYFRNLDDYVKIMRAHDLLLLKKSVAQDQNGKNISFLIFKKCEKNPIF